MEDKAYMKTIICPVCGSKEVDDYEIIDLEGTYVGSEQEDGLIEHHVGRCCECGAELEWKCVYKFYGITDVGELY